MGSTVLYMSMSLDGFIAGPNETDDNGLGDGGGVLHEWVFPPEGGVNTQRELVRLRVLTGEGDVTHLRYRIRY